MSAVDTHNDRVIGYNPEYPPGTPTTIVGRTPREWTDFEYVERSKIAQDFVVDNSADIASDLDIDNDQTFTTAMFKIRDQYRQRVRAAGF